MSFTPTRIFSLAFGLGTDAAVCLADRAPAWGAGFGSTNAVLIQFTTTPTFERWHTYTRMFTTVVTDDLVVFFVRTKTLFDVCSTRRTIIKDDVTGLLRGFAVLVDAFLFLLRCEFDRVLEGLASLLDTLEVDLDLFLIHRIQSSSERDYVLLHSIEHGAKFDSVQSSHETRARCARQKHVKKGPRRPNKRRPPNTRRPRCNSARVFAKTETKCQ